MNAIQNLNVVIIDDCDGKAAFLLCTHAPPPPPHLIIYNFNQVDNLVHIHVGLHVLQVCFEEFEHALASVTLVSGEGHSFVYK